MSVFFTRRGKAPQRVNYVEYLVSNGTQYILLNYKPNQNTRIVCDCQADSLNAGGSFPFGARTNYGDHAFDVALTPTQLFYDYGNSYEFVDCSFTSQRVVIDANKTTCKITGTGTVTATLNAATFTTVDNMALFTLMQNGSPLTGDAAWHGKVWSYQIYESDVLLYDLWPCYDPNGVACLYDKVEKKYYYNAGTGAFTTEQTPATPIAVTITGTGDSSRCYATINGTKQYSAGTHEVYAGDTITFGVYGAGKSPGTITIDGTKVLNVTDGSVKTYDWTVPSGISIIKIIMEYNSKGRGIITVRTDKKHTGGSNQ